MEELTRRNYLRSIGLALACLARAAPAVGAESTLPLAIRGYDPVAFFTIGQATPGATDFEYRWDEHLYRFANADHLEMFKREPVRYAPQFENYCAMALARGEFVEGNPENWLINEGRLYIFALPVGVERFGRELAGNEDRAKLNWRRAPQR